MSAEFKSVAKSTLSDEVAQRVVQLIHDGVYEAGDQLPTITEMARRFGVGHPTLREALKKLEALGVVNIEHGSGVYVQNAQDVLLLSNPIFAGEVSKKMMLDLIEARIPLELTSVGQAAENATDENIQQLEDLLDEAEANIRDGEALNQANMAFHCEVAIASGNMVIAQMLEVLSNLFEQEQRTLLDIHGSRNQDHSEHIHILEAIRAGDKELAQQRMREHLEGVRQILVQWNPEENPLP